ncbi:DUF3889 domain-containing protein [Aquibacillus saliphilus]|uniref:DUF3889 domain-containing protein n=1 Tax=Aquibacillus saliphilus TaxID=1909422 RepID=UPI001CEFC3ED|nr:DUF3889 domain-containing protein [Aquibacillus saliphilus]
MYYHHFYSPNSNQQMYIPHQVYPCSKQQHNEHHRNYLGYSYYGYRQQVIRGQATWTEGGQTTKCGIPWSENQYMTAAVGEDTPYQCGQTLKIRSLSTGRELIVTIVDTVPGFPPNRINLHQKAFVALGANPDVGLINIEIDSSPELEEEKWGKYLLEVTQTAYPSYHVVEYSSVAKTEVSPDQTKETYQYTLQSPQETIKVRGNVIYNPITDRIISFDIEEV